MATSRVERLGELMQLAFLCARALKLLGHPSPDGLPLQEAWEFLNKVEKEQNAAESKMV